MAPKMLFSASLDDHMNAYMQEIKMNEINQQYQLAQANIVRQGERMLLSQADIMNKLEYLKAELKKDIKLKPATIHDIKPIKAKSSVKSSKLEEHRPDALKTTPKGTIIGLPEILEAKQQLRTSPPKETSIKTKSPMQKALEAAAGSPSIAKAQSKASSPTYSEAPTVASATFDLDIPDKISQFNSDKAYVAEKITKIGKYYKGNPPDTFIKYVKAFNTINKKQVYNDPDSFNKSIIKLGKVYQKFSELESVIGSGLRKKVSKSKYKK